MEETNGIGRLLSEELILIRPPFTVKLELLEALVARAAAVRSLRDPERLLRIVLERESHGLSTTLDTGLSLPHARVPGLGGMAAALGILGKDISDPARPKLPIRVMLILFSPDAPESHKRHLVMLREAAQLFQVPFIRELEHLQTPAQVVQRIHRWELEHP